jgi:hypothetical protein
VLVSFEWMAVTLFENTPSEIEDLARAFAITPF